MNGKGAVPPGAGIPPGGAGVPPGGIPGGGKSPLSQLDVNVEELPIVKCRNCGGILWTQAFHIRKISPLVSPTGKEELGTLPVLVCAECKTEVKTSLMAQKLEEDAQFHKGREKKPEGKEG